MTSTINLSLLARGVGEVKRNGSEKIDVILEPDDYYNFTQTRLYLPPIHSQGADGAYYENKRLSLPKTFITRKGALLLFSEDFALKSKGLEYGDSENKKNVESSFHELDLHTVDDLAKSILSYGGIKDEINLHFVKERQVRRCVRPGYSARRYLSKLTRSFDETFLNNLVTKGYLSEKSIFQTNILLPNIRKRINDDLSYMPAPYRIMHQMLLAPGMLSGYSFYRQPTETQSDQSSLEQEGDTAQVQEKGELKIVEIKDGEVRSVVYSDLSDEQKKNVLADLLVKSAISHALEKQKQVIRSRSQSIQDDSDDQVLMISGRASLRSSEKEIHEFDMADAVRSYIQSQVSDHLQDEITETIISHRRSKATPRRPVDDDRSPHKHVYATGDSDSQKIPPIVKKIPSVQDANLSSTTPLLPPIESGRRLVEVHHDDGTVNQIAVDDDGVPIFKVEPPTPQNSTIREKRKITKKQAGVREIREDMEDEEELHREEHSQTSPKKERKRHVEHLKTVKDTGISSQSILSPSSSVTSRGAHMGQHLVFETSSQSTRSDYTTESPILPPAMPRFRGKALRAGGVPKVKETGPKPKGSVVLLPGGDIVKVGGSVSAPGGDVTSYTSRTADEYSTTEYETERDDWPSKQGHSSRSYQEQESEFAESEREAGGSVHSSEHKKHETASVQKNENWNKSVPSQPLSDKPSKQELARESYESGNTASEISEEELVHRLSDQAHRIAAAILSRPGTGLSLTEDAQKVSELESGKLSVAEEYKTLLKDTINSALLQSQGNEANLVPDDADIDDEVIRAIAQQDDLGPDDLEITENERGQQVVRIKSSRKEAIKEAKEKKRAQSKRDSKRDTKAAISVNEPQSSQYSDSYSRSGRSDVDENKSEKSKSPHLLESSHSGVAPLSRGLPQFVSSKTEQRSEVVSVSGLSESSGQKRELIHSSSKSGANKEESKEEFVVRTVRDSSELQRLYGPIDSSPPKTRESKKPRVPIAKASKKTKKRANKSQERKKSEPKTSDSESSPTRKHIRRKKSEKSETSTSHAQSDSESIRTENKEDEEEEMEFIIVRDEFSDTEPEDQRKGESGMSSKSKSYKSTALPSVDAVSDTDSVHQQRQPSPAADASLHTVSSKEARAAERAARANKKREEVERRRREREELQKRQKEELDERERIQREMEEERRRKEEERRMQREHEEEERRRQEREEQERERRRRLEAEREKKMREEYARKLEQLKQQKLEEDRKRRELAEQRQREEEERRLKEQEMLATMSEKERIEYLKRKEEEEERRRIELEERRLREAEEMARLEVEARLLAEAMAMKQAEMERRLQFNRSLNLEAHGLEHTLNITEAFTWSYFELLQWLGLDLPDFERMKAGHI